MGDIGRALAAHCHAAVLVDTKRGHNGTELLAFFVKFKGVELHGKIELGEVLVLATTAHNIINLGQWVAFPFEDFVEFSEVRDPADGAVFLGNDEGREGPFGRLSGAEDTDLNQAVKLFLEGFLMDMGNGIGRGIIRNSIRFEFQVNRLMRVVTQFTIKDSGVLGKNGLQLVTMGPGQVRLLVSNFSGSGTLILGIQYFVQTCVIDVILT